MNKKSLIVIILTLIVVSVGVLGFNLSYKSGRLYVGGISLAMSDENLSEVEVILRDNLLTSFTVKVSSSSPKYYIIIPSSDFNNLKETLYENESIEITEAKQQDEDIYAYIEGFLGKNELQEHLDRYSLEVKEINWIYVNFESNVRKSGEIADTLDILENESNMISAFPDVLDR